MTQTAVGYCRVSGDNQIDGDGLPRQEAAIRAWAESHGVRILRVYHEEGVCGRNETQTRPAWARMMLSLNEGSSQCKCIIVEKLDRLSRDLMVQELAIRDLAKRHIRLISTAEGDAADDPRNPSRALIRQIFGAIAQYERSNLTLKMASGRARKRADEGQCEGQKAYGYYPGEAKALEQILAWRANGCSYAEIVRRAGAAGLPVRGSRWHHGTIADIVRRAKP